MRIFKSAHFALVCLVWFALVRFGPEIPRKDNRVPDIENSIEIAQAHTFMHTKITAALHFQQLFHFSRLSRSSWLLLESM